MTRWPRRCELCALWLKTGDNVGTCLEPETRRGCAWRVTFAEDGVRCEFYRPRQKEAV